ncbi:MAG: ATP-binding protein [Geminicoccaceae bacterium]
MRRLIPQGLTGQLLAVLLLALLAGQALSLVIFADERRIALRAANREQVLARTASLVTLLGETPTSLHPRILAATSSRGLRFSIDPTSLVDPALPRHAGNPLAAELREELGGSRPILVEIGDERRLRAPDEDAPAARPSRRAGMEPGHERRPGLALLVSVQLDDGSWLNAGTAFPPPPGWALPSLASLGVSAALVALVVVLLVRRITHPMHRLATAADALGRGEAGAPVPEAGPREVRRTTRAFNRMQARLRRFVEDRTRLLAAISHDLRTPITSLRLRAELVEEEENRERMLVTLDEMERIVEASLEFARQEASSEATRSVDLAALIESVVSDLADLGRDARFAGAPRTPYACRPAGLKRALRNLVENAIAYGGGAEVRLERRGDQLALVVADRGPGIPAEMLEKVLEPFVRLESSRSRETGGIGLGLAIARTIARAHGGDVVLANRAGGGLEASLLLPLAAGAGHAPG